MLHYSGPSSFLNTISSSHPTFQPLWGSRGLPFCSLWAQTFLCLFFRLKYPLSHLYPVHIFLPWGILSRTFSYVNSWVIFSQPSSHSHPLQLGRIRDFLVCSPIFPFSCHIMIFIMPRCFLVLPLTGWQPFTAGLCAPMFIIVSC